MAFSDHENIQWLRKFQANDPTNGGVAWKVSVVDSDITVTVDDVATIVDDAAFTPGTSSVQMIGGFFDDVAPDSVNEGDGGAIRMSGNRNLYTTIRDAAGNERGANVDANSDLRTVAGGITVTVSTTITRPSNTDTYAANDVICDSTSAPTIQTITGCSRYNLGTGTIIDAVLIDGGNETLKLDADFFLFDTTVTMDNDNAAFTPTDTELGTCVGVISFIGGTARSGTAGTSGNCFYPNALAGTPIVFTTVTTTTLYGILVARNAYVPISGETFKIRMKILQD